MTENWSCARSIIRTLRECGVDTAFGVTGGQVVPRADNTKQTWVIALHTQTAKSPATYATDKPCSLRQRMRLIAIH